MLQFDSLSFQLRLKANGLLHLNFRCSYRYTNVAMFKSLRYVKFRSRPRRLIVWFGIHVCLQSWTLFVLCNTLQYIILSNNFWSCICGSIVPPSQFPLLPQNRVLSYGPVFSRVVFRGSDVMTGGRGDKWPPPLNFSLSEIFLFV